MPSHEKTVQRKGISPVYFSTVSSEMQEMDIVLFGYSAGFSDILREGSRGIRVTAVVSILVCSLGLPLYNAATVIIGANYNRYGGVGGRATFCGGEARFLLRHCSPYIISTTIVCTCILHLIFCIAL